MDLQLNDIALFTRITELGTLSAVARERDVPVSQVTRALARLEAEPGLRLVDAQGRLLDSRYTSFDHFA